MATETTLVRVRPTRRHRTPGDSPIDETLEPCQLTVGRRGACVPFSGGGVSDLLDGAEKASEAGTGLNGRPEISPGKESCKSSCATT